MNDQSNHKPGTISNGDDGNGGDNNNNSNIKGRNKHTIRKKQHEYGNKTGTT